VGRQLRAAGGLPAVRSALLLEHSPPITARSGEARSCCWRRRRAEAGGGGGLRRAAVHWPGGALPSCNSASLMWGLRAR
jgi:hypothetical protein